ncbi:DUF2523 domain-containing protein [Vibrio aestuarianus]|uniref:DUF2523 family protein n=1 Tax=Vibrio aestuarianus TaxID=28171 RepID=UPI001558D422|nr:DUF2523 family protein [Vibrio aestuarianus]MDE1222800.1 DUF2523 domain-containing protein [Vibrio aestuarianus]NGZ15629.1 DUF2523 domain-containing protein [Vibrio aestuarianus]NKZ51777.1 DUF2523 domain-containing protein [Vibrio aestuarianus]
MEYILILFQSIGDFFQTIIDFIWNIPSYFAELSAYIDAKFVYLKFKGMLIYLAYSYKVAQYLLEDIGFTQLISSTFNAMPDELRFYAFAFKIPQALSIFFNGLATAFVMKMMRA